MIDQIIQRSWTLGDEALGTFNLALICMHTSSQARDERASDKFDVRFFLSKVICLSRPVNL